MKINLMLYLYSIHIQLPPSCSDTTHRITDTDVTVELFQLLHSTNLTHSGANVYSSFTILQYTVCWCTVESAWN